ncbi:MAG: oligopeptide transport system permease protein AppB [Litorilinea sp.]|nr:MAG: oligopeptide transport system permease protein AppB [Litorilinea sp.]
MWHYIARRIVIFIPTLFGITLISFFIIAMAPGDAATAMISEGGEMIGTEQRAELRARYGLDDPLPVRYLRWLGELLQGNLGVSLIDRRPVSQTLLHNVRLSLEFVLPAFIIGLTLALIFGAWSGFRPYSRFDRIISFISMILIATPSFVLALLALYFLAVRNPWLPSGGNRDIFGPDAATLAKRLPYFVLPVSTLAVLTAAGIIRYVRESVIDVCNEDYVRTARAKGIAERWVLTRHILRNSLIPIITVAALRLPILVNGAILIETVFGWGGMGSRVALAVSQRDFPVIMSATLLTGVAVLVSNLLADILYAMADPRIRQG